MFSYIIISLTFLYLLACCFFYFFQGKLLFKRTKLPTNYRYHYEWPFKELNWQTEDGNLVNGILFEHESPKAILLFLHGNSGHMGRSGNYYARVREYPISVLLYDYRGYGKSTGKPIQKNLYSDVLLVYDWIKESFPNIPIFVHGLSLGSHIATYLASRRKIEYLILETPFLNISHIARYKYPYFPTGLLLRFRLDSSIYLKNIECPICVLHGDCDKTVPLQEAMLLPTVNPNIDFVIIHGGTHKNLKDFDVYKQKLHSIISKFQ